MYDYAEYAPKTTPEALERLDELLARLEAVGHLERMSLAEDIADHMHKHGVRLRDYESRGRKIKVSFSTRGVQVRPGQERAADRWLAGRKLDSAIRNSLRKGSAIPQEVFDLHGAPDRDFDGLRMTIQLK